MQLGEDDQYQGEGVIHVKTPTVPGDLREALEELEGGMATLAGMPVDYQRQAFLFIEQGSRHNRGFRITNFVDVVKFFQQDSGE
jgi:hypothetical protein